MQDIIKNLDDTTAKRILAEVAKYDLKAEHVQGDMAPQLAKAIQDKLGIQPSGETVTDGEMARCALSFLADDPRYSEIIARMAQQTSMTRFVEPVTAILLGAAVVAVLQTRFKFTRSKDGKVAVEIDKKAASDEVVLTFLKKLLSWIPSGPFK